MKQKSFVNIILPIVMIVVLVGTAGYFVFVLVQKSEVPSITQPPPPIADKSTVKESIVSKTWLPYKWGVGVIKFSYPSDWKVEEINFGLTISPDKPIDNYSIRFGGRQITCQNLNAFKCLTFYRGFPIYTFSKDSKILTAFDSLIKTISYTNPDAGFQILFPEAKAQLKPDQQYTIQWKTNRDLQIQRVGLTVYNTARYWQEDPALSVEDIPNTGSYEWTTPSLVKSEGPYLIGVSYCEPIIPPPAETISSCKPHEGWSDPFYISISN